MMLQMAHQREQPQPQLLPQPLPQQALQSALNDAGASTHVVVLNPGLWYLSGGGLQSVRLQVDEVVNAVR